MNKKNVLILNTRYNIEALLDFFDLLAENYFKIFLLSKNKNLLKKFKEKKWKGRKIKFWPKINNSFDLFVSFVFLPIYLPIICLFLLTLKQRKKIDTIICFSKFDRIFLSPLAHILKIKTIWFILPGISQNKEKGILRLFIKLSSKYATIFSFSKYSQNKLLEKKYFSNNLKTIKPGIKICKPHQENLFNRLAKTAKSTQLKKFFTIGTVLELNNQQKLETIFKATKKIITVIPNIQIIVIGDGDERKNLSWLTKKMGIGNMVWFVGYQQYLSRWLENLDVYLISINETKLTDIYNTLRAMDAHIPVIAPRQNIWPEIIKDNISGILLEDFNSEAIATEIIRLKKNLNTRKYLGKNANEEINNNYKIEKIIKNFISSI